MKRLFILLAVISVILTSCNNKNYTINGTLPTECEGYRVYLSTTFDNRILDSTIVVNGAFSFSGKCSAITMAQINSVNPQDGSHSYYSELVLEPGTITIHIADNDSVSGTPHNNLLQQLRATSSFPQIELSLEQLYEQWATTNNPVLKDSIEEIITHISDSCNAIIHAHAMELYNSNKDNEFGCSMLLVAFEHSNYTSAQLDSIMNLSSPIAQNNTSIKAYVNRIQCSEATSAGHHYIDLPGIDFSTGESTLLSTLIQGKIAVVDFWASWCGPCKQEIRDNLIKLYQQYKNQGVVVVGVDVWDKIDKHAAAVEALGIEYPQLIDTTLNASTQYGFNAIPQIILINADGTIVARDLRGKAIEEAILQILNK